MEQCRFQTYTLKHRTHTLSLSSSLRTQHTHRQGLFGELGLADKKSSSKPTFVTALDQVQVKGLACGYGQTFFLVAPETAQSLKQLDASQVQGL